MLALFSDPASKEYNHFPSTSALSLNSRQQTMKLTRCPLVGDKHTSTAQKHMCNFYLVSMSTKLLSHWILNIESFRKRLPLFY